MGRLLARCEVDRCYLLDLVISKVFTALETRGLDHGQPVWHHGNETPVDTHECCTAEPARSSTYAQQVRMLYVGRLHDGNDTRGETHE